MKPRSQVGDPRSANEPRSGDIVIAPGVSLGSAFFKLQPAKRATGSVVTEQTVAR